MDTSQEKDVYGYSTQGFDWNVYARVRPRYPASLWTQIMEYHKSHRGGTSAAHDIGTGYGVVAKQFLMEHFGHIYASDPVAHNLDTARGYLSEEIAQGKVTCYQAAAEHVWLPSGSMDLVTAFECMHWTDWRRSIPAIAEQLKPGGTFAALYYHPRPVLYSERELDAEFGRIYGDLLDEHYEELSQGLELCFDGLNSCCPLPTELFEKGARRIRINTDLVGGEYPFRLGCKSGLETPPACHVGPNDICARIIDEHNWTDMIAVDCLFDYLKTLPLEAAAIEKRAASLWTLIERHEPKNVKIRIDWMVDLVLATRKHS